MCYEKNNNQTEGEVVPEIRNYYDRAGEVMEFENSHPFNAKNLNLKNKLKRAALIVSKLKHQLARSERRHKRASEIISTIQDGRFIVAYFELAKLSEDLRVVRANRRHNAGETYIILTVK